MYHVSSHHEFPIWKLRAEDHSPELVNHWQYMTHPWPKNLENRLEDARIYRTTSRIYGFMCHCVPQNSHLCLQLLSHQNGQTPKRSRFKMLSHFQEENKIFRRAKNCPSCIGDDACQMNQSPALEQRQVRSQVAGCGKQCGAECMYPLVN